MSRPIRAGVVLPIFRPDAGLAFDVARRAEEAGIDGVFCYDHLWPMGQPERPALSPWPVLGAVAATSSRLAVGTLVSRVGLVPDDVLLGELAALETLAPGRLIAAMGTGDRLSAGENEAYGVDFSPAADRRAALRRCIRTVLDWGIEAWVGDGAPATRRIAQDEGAAANLWNTSPEEVAAQASLSEVTWSGPLPATGSLMQLVARLFAAGATWAVFPWPVDLQELAAAAAATG